MKLDLRGRILLSILSVTFLCVGVISWYTYSSAASRIEQQYVDSMQEKLQLQAAELDRALHGAYRAAVAASYDETLRAQTEAYLSLPPGDNARTEAAWGISALLSDLRLRARDVDSFYLYLPDAGQLISSNDYRAVADASLLTDFPEAGSGFAPVLYENTIGGIPQTVYVYTRPLELPDSQHTALLLTMVEERTLFYDLLDASAMGTGFYIVDDNRLVCSAQDAGMIGQPLAQSLGFPALTHDVQAGTCADGEQVYASVRAPFCGLRVVSTAGKSELIRSLSQARGLLLVFLLCLIPVSFLLASVLARWLCRPIYQLMEVMGRVGSGDLAARTDLAGGAEFRALGARFNEMVQQIGGLLNTLVEERTRKKQAELYALQHQIQPHFMYNTLNAIRYAAILQGNAKIGEQLEAFIHLLEASVNKKGAFLPLAEEIALVQNYVSLQQFRYLDSFEAAYDVSEEASACFVPRLLLQPLVENSLLHGLDIKRKDGRIDVRAWCEGGMLMIEVQDNGKGMTDEECRALLVHNPEEGRQFTGIGLSNIQERLSLYYGGRASFSITSAPGAGTCGRITLPASLDAKEYAIP